MELEGQVNALSVALTVCFGLIAFIVRSFTVAARETSKALQTHIDKCAEVPKAQILETLRAISAKQDSELAHLAEFKAEIRQELILHRERFHTIDNSLMILVGRQQQKDKEKDVI